MSSMNVYFYPILHLTIDAMLRNTKELKGVTAYELFGVSSDAQLAAAVIDEAISARLQKREVACDEPAI